MDRRREEMRDSEKIGKGKAEIFSRCASETEVRSREKKENGNRDRSRIR